MYRIELIDKNENLIDFKNFHIKKEMMEIYNIVLNNFAIRHCHKGLTIQLFEGIDKDNLQELTEYRKEL